MQLTVQVSSQARDRVIAATAIVSECRRQDGIMFIEFILVFLDKVPSLDKVCGERVDKWSSGTHGDIYINPSAKQSDIPCQGILGLLFVSQIKMGC